MPLTGPLLAGMPSMYDEINTPFDALRTAQLQALGLDAAAAATVMPFLLPPEPMSKAAEALLLSGARFLVDQGVFRAPSGYSDSFCDVVYNQNDCILSEKLQNATCDQHICSYDEREDLRAVADFGFFFEAQALAVDEKGERTFSFSGRTWQTVLHMAEAHRREQLVADAVERARRAGDVVGDPLAGSREASMASLLLWRNSVAWDTKSEEMLACRMEDEHPPKPRSALPNMRWHARDVAAPEGSAAAQLCGHWRMSQLVGMRALLVEAEAQNNCLCGDHYILYENATQTSYWSLNFEPELLNAEQAREAVNHYAAALRLTVEVEAADSGRNPVVNEAKAHSDEDPLPESLRALAHWARTCGVEMGPYAEQLGDADSGE